MSKSFCERLIESFESRPEKTAMRIVGDDSQSYTYGQLLKQRAFDRISSPTGKCRIRRPRRAYRRKSSFVGDRLSRNGSTRRRHRPARPARRDRNDHKFSRKLRSKSGVPFARSDRAILADRGKARPQIPAVVWNHCDCSICTMAFSDFEDWAATEFPPNLLRQRNAARKRRRSSPL